MKATLLFIIVIWTSTQVLGQEYSTKELRYKPVNLEEAVDQLYKIQGDSIRQEIISMSENEFISGSHLALGMWIRNNWGLWRGKALADFFNSIGVFHPDDMSSIILTSYYRDLQGLDWKLEEQIKFYQDYWEEMNHNQNKKE